jgi:Zn-dependent protease
MPFFQVPPPTRYDLNFTLAGIPVRVHPLFWLIAILFGLNSNTLIGLVIWVVVVFISILIHELGHSMAMRMYGQESFIVLHMMGGLAVPQSSRWRARGGDESTQQIVISLAGPIAGFLFAGLVIALVVVLGGAVSINWLFGFIPIPSAFLPAGGSIGNTIISVLLWVNVFWGLINLIPVYPLDGGHVARNLFIKADPWDGFRKSLWLSTIAGAIVAVAGLIFLRSIWIGLLFGILALQSYQTLQGRGGGMF